MMQQLLLLRNFVLALGLLPSLAWAVSGATEVTFETLPGLAYVITFISSSLGGLAGTLHRMSAHMAAGAAGIQHPKIFVLANMFGGWTAGWFSFLVGTHAGTPVLLVQGVVLISAFGGAAVIERLVDKYFPTSRKR